jgi:outer membrane protein assembly factor BamB
LFVLAALFGGIKFTEHRIGVEPAPSELLSAALAGDAETKSKGSSDGSGAGWTSFRGNPTQTGVATFELPAELQKRWTFPTKDAIEGAPAIQDGTVFIGSFDGFLYAIDLKTGNEKWKFKAGGFKAAPALRDKKVYIGDIDGMFFCLDAASGEKLWSFETKGEIDSSANFTGENILFGSGDEMLYCLSKEGKKLWTFKVPGGPVLASPAVVKDRTFVSGCDSTLHIIDVKNGEELASLELNGQTGATPAVIGDSLYVGTMGNQFLALDWKKPEKRWAFEAEERPSPFYSSAAATDALILVGSRDKYFYALDRKTGKPAWTFKTGGQVDSSPIVSGKRVYFGSLDRNLYVIDLEKGTLVQKIGLDSRVPGSPAAAEGCLVIGTEKGTVYCFEGKK